MKTDQQIALDALALLLPSRAASYESWLAVGMALHAAGCSCSDWERWHPDGAADHSATCRRKWSGFGTRPDSNVTVGTLVKWAREDSGKDPFTVGGEANGEHLDLESPFEVIEPGGWHPGGDMLTYVKAVFRSGDKIGFNTNAYKNDKGKWVPSDSGVYGMDYDYFVQEIKQAGPLNAIGGQYEREAGVWIRVNPLDGKGVKNTNVSDYRHVLVECDCLPVSQQQAIIEDMRIPCSAIVDSGGKSIHAVVRIDAGSNKELYAKRVAQLFDALKERSFVVDSQCRNASRLSRLPGIMRGDRRQFLIATNVGCSSWGEWEDYILKKQTASLSIKKLLAMDIHDTADAIIGKRFVYQGGTWIIVSQSGVGKSSLTIQMAVNFALGRTIFGLNPPRPLRVLIIQAENSDLDIAEPVQGVAIGEGLSEDDIAKVNDNIQFISEDSKFGEDFCNWFDKILPAYMPLDLVFIDPLLSYIGADLTRQGDVSKFLRNWLNPVIHRHNVAVAFIHHTGKVRKAAHSDDWDDSYLGMGSSDMTNWARAVTVLERISKDPVTVTIKHPKRGNRLDVRETVVQHSTDGMMRWVECDRTDAAFAEIAATMPPLKDSRFPTNGSTVKWLMETLRIDLEKASSLRDCWRKDASRFGGGPWERVEGGNGKWIYQGKKHVENQTLDITEEFNEIDLP